jgi:biopolymer transport protein ExbD
MSINATNLSFNNIRKPVYETKLNLVALMDIFTILVFFLLLNNGDANELENAKFVKLPDSSVKAAPHVEALIVISEHEIMLNGESVVSIDDVANSKKKFVQPLIDALDEYEIKKGELSVYEKANGLPVTIMGDQSVPFSLLERVMVSCSVAGFRDISLAVNRIAGSVMQFQSAEQLAQDESSQLGGE